MCNKNFIISIIVPTYNRSAIIHRAVNSIKKQTFVEWECIIVDDYSTDKTEEVVHSLIKDDHRFVYLKNIRRKGAPGARNTGILASRGEYIVLFDSDNVMHPDFLSKVYTKLKKEGVNICGSFSRVYKEGEEIQTGSFQWEGYGDIHTKLLSSKTYFDNSSTLIEKTKLLSIGLLDERCPSYQEWDTHIQLSNISTYTTVREELIDYYRGGVDTLSKSVAKAVMGRLYILNKYKNEFRLKTPISYILHCLATYVLIKDRLDEESCVYYLQSYKETTKGYHLIVWPLYMMRKVKRKLLKLNHCNE